MLPARFVGTVVTADGEEPFVLDTATGTVTVGRHEDPDPQQARVGKDELAAAERQVRAQVPGAREVRFAR
jgi:hypothetical protein